jgi:biotin operon repressor
MAMSTIRNATLCSEFREVLDGVLTPEGGGVDRREFIERYAQALTAAGMQRMAARVLAAFTLSERPTLTMPELGAELGVSAGAVSGAVKLLLHLGMIERAPVPGSRRDHYRLPERAWYESYSRAADTLAVFQQLADEGIPVHGADSLVGRRLAEMRDFYRFMQEEIPRVLERWEAERDKRRGSAD